eukprot:Skav207876  [mRNA]  locus=scaffold664:356198:360894:- [translate_table: standard]
MSPSSPQVPEDVPDSTRRRLNKTPRDHPLRSGNRFHNLLRDLLAEHEKQQSLLRMEIQRLSRSDAKPPAPKVPFEIVDPQDPDRVDLEVPSERKEDDVVLALTNEAITQLL